MSTADDQRIERRSGQRFPYQVPVPLRVPGQASGTGFTQDLSSRGAMIWTDFPLCEGQMVEMTLVMPSEITLGDDMPIRCRARVLRRERSQADQHAAVALRFEQYDYLIGASALVECHTGREVEFSTRHS
jgi:hypothetical protein